MGNIQLWVIDSSLSFSSWIHTKPTESPSQCDTSPPPSRNLVSRLPSETDTSFSLRTGEFSLLGEYEFVSYEEVDFGQREEIEILLQKVCKLIVLYCVITILINLIVGLTICAYLVCYLLIMFRELGISSVCGVCTFTTIPLTQISSMLLALNMHLQPHLFLFNAYPHVEPDSAT